MPTLYGRLEHNDTEIQKLHNLLADAYPTLIEAKHLVQKSGFPPADIPYLYGTMSQLWMDLMDKLAAAGLLQRTIELAANDPSKTAFKLQFESLLLPKPGQLGAPLYENKEQLQSALLSAYRLKDDLRQMVAFGMSQSLDAIADGANLTIVTFNLIQWAEQHGRMDELVKAAYQGNSGNPELKAFVKGYFGELPEIQQH